MTASLDLGPAREAAESALVAELVDLDVTVEAALAVIVEVAVAAAVPHIERAIRDGEDVETEWALEYEAGYHGCEDEADAVELAQWYVQPNRVVRREVRRGPWVARGGEATE
jgi:hypothetical protein